MRTRLELWPVRTVHRGQGHQEDQRGSGHEGYAITDSRPNQNLLMVRDSQFKSGKMLLQLISCQHNSTQFQLQASGRDLIITCHFWRWCICLNHRFTERHHFCLATIVLTPNWCIATVNCAASALLRSSHLLITDKLILCNTSFRFPTSTTRRQPVSILKSHTLLPVNQSLSICLSFPSLPISKYHSEDQKIEQAWLSGSASHDPLCPQLSPRVQH